MTKVLKPTISVPSGAYEIIERARARAGLNRSEFFTRAGLKLAGEIGADELTAQINQFLEADDPTEQWVVERSVQVLAEEQE